MADRARIGRRSQEWGLARFSVLRAKDRAGWAGVAMTLDREDIAAIAQAVVELLKATDAAPAGTELLTAAQVAARYGVARSFVYEHADELGAVRLGGGSKPRLRFDSERVSAALLCLTRSASREAQVPALEPKATHRPRRSMGTGVDRVPGSVDLLPIRGAQR